MDPGAYSNLDSNKIFFPKKSGAYLDCTLNWIMRT